MAIEPRIIKFYETTLRDGEQTPGVNYFPEEKLAIAQALADMGFDTLDCGFPISSPGEFEAVRLIASKVDNAEICAIARANPADIERAWDAVRIAAHSAIQPFISVRDHHQRGSALRHPVRYGGLRTALGVRSTGGRCAP